MSTGVSAQRIRPSNDRRLHAPAVIHGDKTTGRAIWMQGSHPFPRVINRAPAVEADLVRPLVDSEYAAPLPVVAFKEPLHNPTQGRHKPMIFPANSPECRKKSFPLLDLVR
jgi:hypothetical protein